MHQLSRSGCLRPPELTHYPEAGLSVAQQHGITVRYDGIVGGEYAVDLSVEETIIVEVKAIKAPDSAHTAQCLNDLKATGLPLCLPRNFAKFRPRSGVWRTVCQPARNVCVHLRLNSLAFLIRAAARRSCQD
jgi:GxxExxY protein